MTCEIITIGEPLVEFSATGDGSLSGCRIFQKGFGGDTANFALSAARSGAKVSYITIVGNDSFGRSLLELWEQEGIDISHVKTSRQNNTGIYFISRDGGEHKFTYIRKHSAASGMTPKILPHDSIKQAKLLHLSGITQAISITACDTTFKAIDIARESNTLVSYDPNLRTRLWPIERAKAIIHATVPKTDILFPSYDDAFLLTGLQSPENIADFYLNMGADIVILKMGAKGALLAHGNHIRQFDPFSITMKDASGAGDTFCGAFAAMYVNGSSLEECMEYAGTAAALSTQIVGCVDSIPGKKEILNAQRNNKEKS